MDCIICTEEFDSNLMSPRISPTDCGHTICENCVKNILKTNSAVFTCPICKKKHQNPKLQDFPKNFSLIQLIQEPKKKDPCPEHDKKRLKFFDPKTKKLLCSICKKSSQNEQILNEIEFGELVTTLGTELKASITKKEQSIEKLANSLLTKKNEHFQQISQIFEEIKMELAQVEKSMLKSLEKSYTEAYKKLPKMNQNGKSPSKQLIDGCINSKSIS